MAGQRGSTSREETFDSSSDTWVTQVYKARLYLDVLTRRGWRGLVVSSIRLIES